MVDGVATLPLFLRKNVILLDFKFFGFRRSISAEAKEVAGAFLWRRIGWKWCKRSVTSAGRASIGDLRADSGWHPNRSTHYSMKVIECQLVTE